MNDFKVGDRVRLVYTTAEDYPPVGTEGVVAVTGLGVTFPIDVQFDGYPHGRYPVRLSEIRKVEGDVWEVKWRDGFVEGFSTAETNADILSAVQYILESNYPLEITITKRSGR